MNPMQEKGKMPEEKENLTREKESICAWRGMSQRAYIIPFILIAVLIIAGAANGGLRDVLIKAINICTECIGLG